MSTITAAELRARIETVTNETADAFRQYNAIGELRRKVEKLRHDSLHASTDAECEAAARELVKSSEDLRIAEIIEPRKRAAKAEASQKRNWAIRGAVRSAHTHFEALRVEAYSLATAIIESLVAPSVKELRTDQDPRAVMMWRAVNQVNGFGIGSWDAFQLCQEIEDQLKNADHGVESYAHALLERFDATTARFQADIAKLKKIHAAAVSSAVEVVSTGGEFDGSSGATADQEEQLATV